MSYSCRITTDSYINESDIDNIINNLPPHLSSPLSNSKQSWGWHTGVDVYKPELNSISIGGSYSISGHIAEQFVEYLKIQLQVIGYKIINTKWSW